MLISILGFTVASFIDKNCKSHGSSNNDLETRSIYATCYEEGELTFIPRLVVAAIGHS